MIKTFKQLQDDVLRWGDQVDDTNIVRELVKQALNAAQQRRLAERKWAFMKWPQPVTFTTVPGQRAYTLHQEFFRPIYFWNRTAAKGLEQIVDETLTAVTRGPDGYGVFVDDEAQWTDNVGSAHRFELRGMSPVMNQPAEASVLTVSSSSTADSSKQIIVTGETANGVESETIETGANGTANSGQLQFTSIIDVTKVGTWSGTMTLVAGSVTLLQLFATETARRYRQIWLFNEPQSAETIEYLFYRQIRPMTNDEDIPQIPPPHNELLTYDALIALAAYDDVEPRALAIWKEIQYSLEQSMIDTYVGPDTIDAQAQYVTYIPR